MRATHRAVAMLATCAALCAACSSGGGVDERAGASTTAAPPTTARPSDTPDATSVTGPATASATTTPPPEATSPADATPPSVRLADLPQFDTVAGAERASLSAAVTTSTAHVHRLVAARDEVIAVGSTEDYAVGARPAVWRFVEAGGTLARTSLTTPDAVAPPPENGSAVDAVELPDGTLLVLGWLSDGTGPRTVLWEFADGGVAGTEVHRFEPSELGGDPDRLVLDESGRPWVITRRRGMGGAIDVATRVNNRWQTLRLADGLVTQVNAAATPTGVEVTANRIEYDAGGFVVAAGTDRWDVALARDRIVFTASVLEPGIAVADLERFDGTTHMLVRTSTGAIELRSRSGVTDPGTSVVIPAHPSELPMAIASTDGVPVVLVLGPEGPDERSEGRAFRIRDGVAAPWSGAFSIDFQRAAETNDYPATTWLGRPVLLDRRVDDEVAAIRLDDAGANGTGLGIPRMLPERYDRVDELQMTSEGLLAVVSTVNAGATGRFFLGEGFVALFGPDGWDSIGNGQIEMAATWRGSPLLTSSSDTGMDQYVFDGGSADLITTAPVPGRVRDIAVFGDTLVLAAESGGLLRPFAGPVGASIGPIEGLPDDAAVLEICDGTSRPVFVVETASGARWLAAATLPTGGRPTITEDAIVPLQSIQPGPARPFCWQTAGGNLVVVQDSMLTAEVATATAATFTDDMTELSFGAIRGVPPGVQMFDAVSTADGELTVGRVSDRWGEWDAAVLRWDGMVVEAVAIFGGNGRQEARTVVEVEDGWLVGGTDNGEAVAWKLPDGREGRR